MTAVVSVDLLRARRPRPIISIIDVLIATINRNMAAVRKADWCGCSVRQMTTANRIVIGSADISPVAGRGMDLSTAAAELAATAAGIAAGSRCALWGAGGCGGSKRYFVAEVGIERPPRIGRACPTVISGIRASTGQESSDDPPAACGGWATGVASLGPRRTPVSK
jgi:hypothetical protein